MSSLSRREFLAASASISVAGIAQSDGAKLTISTFTEEVTPPVGHPCMGGGIAPVKEIIDPLYANGFVLRGAGKPVAVVAVDWCEIRNDAYDRWREVIASAIGTTRERVMVMALHQHDAPIADLAAQKMLEDDCLDGVQGRAWILQNRRHCADLRRDHFDRPERRTFVARRDFHQFS